MLKLIKIPVWTIIVSLFSMIGAISHYAYSRDIERTEKTEIAASENAKSIQEIKEKYVSKQELKDIFKDHQEIHKLESQAAESRNQQLIYHFDLRIDDLKEYLKNN